MSTSPDWRRVRSGPQQVAAALICAALTLGSSLVSSTGPHTATGWAAFTVVTVAFFLVVVERHARADEREP